MTKPLEDALAQIIQSTTTSMTTAVDFLSAQIPDVIYQLLLWNTIYYGVQCILGIILAVYVYRWAYQLFTIGRSTEATATPLQSFCANYNNDGSFDDAHPGMLAAGAVILISTVASVELLNIAWLQILIAPKIWLIEYAAHLVK